MRAIEISNICGVCVMHSGANTGIFCQKKKLGVRGENYSPTTVTKCGRFGVERDYEECSCQTMVERKTRSANFGSHERPYLTDDIFDGVRIDSREAGKVNELE
jgi:hypothetical protein